MTDQLGESLSSRLGEEETATEGEEAISLPRTVDFRLPAWCVCTRREEEDGNGGNDEEDDEDDSDDDQKVSGHEKTSAKGELSPVGAQHTVI